MKLLVVLLIAAAGVYFFSGYSVGAIPLQTRPPVQNLQALSSPPVQTALNPPKVFPFKNGKLTLLAYYQVTARILSTQTYAIGKESSLSPIDLALGWQKMADPAILKYFEISQANRFYHFTMQGNPLISVSEAAMNSANTHIIPANREVYDQVKNLQKGQVVTLSGFLISYYEGDSNSWWDWKSSMTRADTGGGACEVMYVEHVVLYQ